MSILKGLLCLVLFLGALLGAAWPILKDGEFNWLFDMDVVGGVQVTYSTDFSPMPINEQTDENKASAMAKSHARLDARLANFQGVDVKVQVLGDNRILVEVPGIRNIEKVKQDLGEQQVVSFAHITSIKKQKDEVHKYELSIGDTKLWGKVKQPIAFGDYIIYDKMDIDAVKGQTKYHLSLPLSGDGQAKMAKLTYDIVQEPARVDGSEEKGIPLLAFFLDETMQDHFFVQQAAIRQGVISVPSLFAARNLKKLLSSGPMPVKFHVESERAISPLTGRVFQEKGVAAFVISVIILIIFIGLCYIDRPWFLFTYSVTLVFWFLSLVTLANFHLIRVSLLQMAALALLLGMNTDALVLVFQDIYKGMEKETRFDYSLVGEAFKVEWMVVFWGMVTTLVVIFPLAIQGDLFRDYVLLMGMGMVINLLGFIFARLLMSLPIGGEMSRVRVNVPVRSLSYYFSKVNFNRFNYTPLSILLVSVAAFGFFVFPKITYAPIFAGGTALELRFPEPVNAANAQTALMELLKGHVEVNTEENGNGQTDWLMAKFSGDVQFTEQQILDELDGRLGTRPEILGIESISKTLVAQTKLKIGSELFFGLIFLAIIALFIYNLSAGLRIILALAHDVIICLGFISFAQIPLDLTVIAALAMVIGYSINDSIVILHKLRTLKLGKEEENGTYFDLDDSDRISALPSENIRDIPARVIITTVTTILPMTILGILAGGVFRNYGMVVLVGVLAGTLSSLYIVGKVVPWGFANWSKF